MNTAFKKGTIQFCQLCYWIPNFNKLNSALKSELSYKMVQIFFSKNIETNYSQWRNLSKVYLSIGHFADGIWMNGVGHSLLSSVWYLEKGPTLRTPFVRADPKSRHLCCMKLIGYSETETGQAIQKKVAQQEQECIYTDKVPYALCQITWHSCTPTTTRDTHIFLLPFLFFNQAFLLFA